MRSWQRVAFVVFLCAAFRSNAAPLLSQVDDGAHREPEPQHTPADCEPYRDLLGKLSEHRIDVADDDFFAVDAKNKARRAVAASFVDTILARDFSDESASFLVQNHVAFRNATSPRLSGRVVPVGPQARFENLLAAAAHLEAGDLVLLGPGTYEIPDARALGVGWTELAIVGQGARVTTLSFVRREPIDSPQRLRLEGMRIECGDNPFIDSRSGGLLHLRECLITGYNSGAGGSNAVYTNEAVVLIEQCAFEGLPGRAARPRSDGGRALDMRLSNWLYVRQTQFIDNEEILRAGFPCTFDGCRMINAGIPRGSGVMPYAGGVFALRDSPKILERPQNVTAFQFATDEVEFVRAASGMAQEVDDRSRDLIHALALHRHLPYWIGLLRHENALVREIAAAHLSRLTSMEVSASPLENGKDDGRLEEGSALFNAELEFARMMQWYEKNKGILAWDEQAKRYQVQRN